MATRIGCDNLVYALMTTEDTATTAPAYGDVVSAPGVMSVNINPNASQDTLFADDGPMDSATTLGKIDVEIKKNELTTRNKADLLGHTIDANGGLVYGDSDVSPYVAMGFRSLKSNGNYRYVWLYKGKFIDPEDNNETKGDSINFQADTIKGQFVKLQYPQQVGDKKIRMWKYELDGDNEGASESVMKAWFDKVTLPAAGAAAANASVASFEEAPALAVAFEAGTVTGSTKAVITDVAASGNHFAFAVTDNAAAAPNVGDVIMGVTTYVSGNNITGVTAGKVVTVYELDADNKVVKYVAHTLVAGEIKA